MLFFFFFSDILFFFPGCTPFDRPYSEGVEEIAEWVRFNPNEVILLQINDEGPSADWGHQGNCSPS
jgi:hypothetical protein